MYFGLNALNNEWILRQNYEHRHTLLALFLQMGFALFRPTCDGGAW